MTKNFLGIDEEYSSIEYSKYVILPVPYEATTSYGSGTQKGPQAIIDASQYVELFDEGLDIEIYKSGIHTARSIVFLGSVKEDFENISNTFRHYLKQNKFVIGIGGEHSISLPIYKAYHDIYENLSVLQFDAHSDLRDEYERTRFSHACVMKRIYEENPNIVQVGIRSQCMEEADFIKEKKIDTFYAYNLKKTGLNETIIDNLNQNIYITIDVDFFDPAIMPSTGTPEPGGFLWDETIDFLKKVFKKRNVVGLDVVELSPITNLPAPNFMVAKLIYKLIGFQDLKK